MLKKLLLTAFASISLASAGTLVFDDFSAAQGPIVNSGSSTVGNRTITLTDLGGTAPVSHEVAVTSGVLDVTNGTGDDSQVVISWAIPAALSIPAGSTNLKISFVVIGSDGNPTSIQLGGVASGNFAIPGNTSNQTVEFAISGPPVGPGALTLTIDGAAGWDLTLDSIGFSWTDPTSTIPEPASFAMIGLGLASLALIRRK